MCVCVCVCVCCEPRLYRPSIQYVASRSSSDYLSGDSIAIFIELDKLESL